MDEAACIPVVSLGEALAPSSPHGYEVAHDIGHALALSGAFYVCDHGIPPRTLAEPFEIAQALFAEPPAAPSRWRRRVSAAAATGPGDCFECCSLRSRLEPAGGACAWIGDAPPEPPGVGSWTTTTSRAPARWSTWRRRPPSRGWST